MTASGQDGAMDWPAGRRVTVTGTLAGRRLDAALAALLPGMGLRGRRRCIALGRALLNGQTAAAGTRVGEGDTISLTAADPPRPCGNDAARLVCRCGEYWLFHKPAGLHSVHLAGGGGPSLEDALPALADLAGGQPPLRLLQRLDGGTSGLLCATASARAAQDFRAAEARGQCEKRYLAVLCGRLADAVTVRNALDTSRRATSTVLPAMAPPVRWTEFFPLRHWPEPPFPSPFPPPGEGLTLAACRIRLGARHQIRAHAAAMGHALWGDGRYGDALAGQFFYLHHGGISGPGLSGEDAPPWPFLTAGDMARAAAWCAGSDEHAAAAPARY